MRALGHNMAWLLGCIAAGRKAGSSPCAKRRYTPISSVDGQSVFLKSYNLREGLFMQEYIVGIDLGGMSAKAALFDAEGKILGKTTVITRASGRV